MKNLPKVKESCFLFQNKYNLLERLPSGRYDHGYRAQSTVTSEKADVILISVRHQTTVAIVRADQFIDAMAMWLDRYHEKFSSLGRYARCDDLMRGNQNRTGCRARDATTRNLVEVTFIPADESVSVYVTRPRAVIEIGIANWTPFMEGSEAWDPRQLF